MIIQQCQTIRDIRDRYKKVMGLFRDTRDILDVFKRLKDTTKAMNWDHLQVT